MSYETIPIIKLNDQKLVHPLTIYSDISPLTNEHFAFSNEDRASLTSDKIAI
jgi:hypothetical protein